MKDNNAWYLKVWLNSSQAILPQTVGREDAGRGADLWPDDQSWWEAAMPR